MGAHESAHIHGRLNMSKFMILLAASSLLTSSLAMAQDARVLMERNISFDMAREIGEAALDACRKDGSNVTVTVLDRNGVVRVAYRDDGAAPHTTENSMRKAYSALTFEAPSASFARRLEEGAGKVAQVHLTGVIALAGGLPIMVGRDVIGSVGISGSKPGADKKPGGTRDEHCAAVGIDKVKDRLR